MKLMERLIWREWIGVGKDQKQADDGPGGYQGRSRGWQLDQEELRARFRGVPSKLDDGSDMRAKGKAEINDSQPFGLMVMLSEMMRKEICLGGKIMSFQWDAKFKMPIRKIKWNLEVGTLRWSSRQK